jgi:hypothetical protein
VFDSGVGVYTGAGVGEGVIIGIAVELFPLLICPGGVIMGSCAALTFFAPAEELLWVPGWEYTIATEATDTSMSITVNTMVRNLPMLLTS